MARAEGLVARGMGSLADGLAPIAFAVVNRAIGRDSPDFGATSGPKSVHYFSGARALLGLRSGRDGDVGTHRTAKRTGARPPCGRGTGRAAALTEWIAT